nr:retrotransposon-related protein [Tanacetum cinerariifolium]
KAWGTRLKFSTAFHPQTDSQTERTIQTLEDMLRSCALEWTGNWDDYICLVEFAYNNSWHASIKCAPFEMLYGTIPSGKPLGKLRSLSGLLILISFHDLVKIEHQRASGLLQSLDIPVWKWDKISMDFVTGLPRTQRRHDAIWVVVDRLTKSAHFLPIRKDYSVSRLAEAFQQEIKAWGTRLKFSTAFHPQTDSQSERTIQTLEDMLRPEMIEVTNKKVAVAKEKLKETRTRQKSYADKHRRSLEFQPVSCKLMRFNFHIRTIP